MIGAIELLDIGEAARFLNVSETSLRRWTNAGLLPCLRVGRRRERRFRRSDLLAFMEQPGAAQQQGNGKRGSRTSHASQDEPVAAIHGNHLCGIYGSDAGRLDLTVPLIVPRFPVEALCAYDARKFSGVELLDALRDHSDMSRVPVGRTLAR